MGRIVVLPAAEQDLRAGPQPRTLQRAAPKTAMRATT